MNPLRWRRRAPDLVLSSKPNTSPEAQRERQAMSPWVQGAGLNPAVILDAEGRALGIMDNRTRERLPLPEGWTAAGPPESAPRRVPMILGRRLHGAGGGGASRTLRMQGEDE